MGDQVASGANTLYEVAHRLTRTRRNRDLCELDAFNLTLAVLETAAHLELLGSHSSVTVTHHDGVRHFTPA